MKGRPATPAATKKATGTHRKDRPTVADAAPPPPASHLDAPPDIEVTLVPKWRKITADLDGVGIVTETDLIRLSRAFRQLANAMLFQIQLEATLRDPEASPSDKTKFQSAITSATTSFNSIVSDLERSVKLRPHTAKVDEWEK